MIKNRRIGIVCLLPVFLSCTSIKLSIPAQFSEQSTRLKVKGLNGWPVNEHVSFGSYKTSRIKRGWHTITSGRTGNFAQVNMEDVLLDVFGVSGSTVESREKDKFHFQIDEGHLSAEVYGWERKETNSFEMRTASGKGLLDMIGHVEDYEYDFAATLLPQTLQYNELWRIHIKSEYDRDADATARFHFPWVQEKGYATDTKDSIFIRSFYVKQVESKDGKQRTMPVRVRSGYELTWDGGVVCIIDAFGKAVWIHNGLEPSEKFLLAAVSTAIMIRRVQDIN